MSATEAKAATRGIGLELRAVKRVFGARAEGTVEAVGGVDLQIGAGQFLALLGPSGCGKSTLLRLIAGLDSPTSGTLSWTRTNSPSPGRARAVGSEVGVPGFVDRARGGAGDRRIAYVFQDAHLLPWRNVLHNVALPLELMAVSRSERLEAAAAAIEQVGLAEAARRYPAQLSGGMRMRVSLARALVTDPELLLLDEPFAALDEITRQQLDDQLYELWAKRRMTVVFVTHSVIEATYLAQRAVVLSRRPGRIVLDHLLDLPTERTAALRTDHRFSLQMRALFEALDHGEGSAGSVTGPGR